MNMINSTKSAVSSFDFLKSYLPSSFFFKHMKFINYISTLMIVVSQVIHCFCHFGDSLASGSLKEFSIELLLSMGWVNNCSSFLTSTFCFLFCHVTNLLQKLSCRARENTTLSLSRTVSRQDLFTGEYYKHYRC